MILPVKRHKNNQIMSYKAYFNIPEDIAYLNTPKNGLIPRAHVQWRRKWDEAFFAADSNQRDQHLDTIQSVKLDFAGLFNCPADQVYLVPNFSFGYNVLLEGLPKGLKYALLEDDYPSVNYAIKSRGFNFELIEVHKGNLEENILKVIKNGKVDVLCLSIVQYISGLKIDLDFIKQLKKDNPDLLIIGDVTQYLGTEAFNFLDSGFDAVAGSGYKWLMAGFGNGYMMLSGELYAILYTAARQRPGPTEPMLVHKPIIDLYFEPGHQDTLTYGTLAQSVRFYKELNINSIESYLKQLQDYAYQLFEERGWLLPAVKDRVIRSSLINLQVPQEVYPLLVQKGIRCFPRGSGIRIGLHLYNDTNDVDRLVELLDKV